MDAFRTWQRQFLSKKGNPNRGFLEQGEARKQEGVT